MEARLREYRAARRRQQTVENAKERVNVVKETVTNTTHSLILLITEKVLRWLSAVVNVVYPWIEKFLDYFPTVSWNMEREDDTKVLIDGESDTVPSETTQEDIITQESSKYFYLKWTVYLMTWLTLFIFFIKIEFGAVFFVVSLLIGVCLNTRTKPRKKGEVSAYSVFNKNCESIDGTLTAQQFEREIMFGPGAVM